MNKRKYYLSLGTNFGNRENNMIAMQDAINKLPETAIFAKSSIIETEPVDVPQAYENMKFLNMTVGIETKLTAKELLSRTLQIEKNLGRIRTGEQNSPRQADIDLIASEDGETINEPPDLILPHPRAKDRDFVLIPLSEIAPHIVEALKNGR